MQSPLPADEVTLEMESQMVSADTTAVVDLVRAELGAGLDAEGSRRFGYEKSLALAIIDSVFSLRSRYAAVEAVIKRYRETRAAEGGDADTDGAEALVAAIGRHGGSRLFGNESVGPGTTVRKYDVVAQVATRFVEAGVLSIDELLAALQDEARTQEIRRLWLGVKGLGKVSWNYLVMLSGSDEVKADVWIRRFVGRAVGETVSADRARSAVLAAAAELGIGSTALDHLIWRTERARR